MRLFFSIDPPEQVQQQIHQLCPRLKGVRLMPADQLHITLQFLDEQPSGIIEDIAAAIAPLTLPDLTIHADGINHFRSGVIWLRVLPDPKLTQLYKSLTYALQQQQIHFQQRNFIPHLTLARCGKPVHSGALEEFSRAFSQQAFEFKPSPLRLKSSQLSPSGARHTIEAVFY